MDNLWYRWPAQIDHSGWEQEALPIGNGHLGCKVFGGISVERIQLNEKTLWSGTVLGVEGNTNGNGNGDCGKSMIALQKLIREEKFQEAREAMNALQGDEIGLGSYQNLGDLWVETEFTDNFSYSDYSRGLCLDTATAWSDFICDGISFHRSCFASAPDKVIVFQHSGSCKKIQLRFQSAQPVTNICLEDNCVFTFGQVGKPEDQGLKYALGILIQTDGKLQKPDAEGGITVLEPKAVTVYISAITNYGWDYPHYRNHDISLHKTLSQRLLRACNKGADTLYQEHLDDYQALYKSASLCLGEVHDDCPTDILLKNYREGKESRRLEELLFKYARYMLIASSRDGSLPANLQGIWNDSNNPAWQSDYHLDINLQMNYWIALNTNITKTMQPLFDYINYCLVPPGRATAFWYTGIGDPEGKKTEGWMVHTQNNAFGHTGPGSVWRWGWLPANGPFLLQNTFEYYRFTRDIDALQHYIYPAMEESAKLWSKLLVEEAETGELVFSPCSSPEHGPVTAGATYDQTMVWQLYSDTIEAAKALKDHGRQDAVSWEIIETLRNQLPRIVPCKVGEWGQIMEWRNEDSWEDRGFSTMGVQFQHRHLSHLLGLYPGHYITQDKPELIAAAEVSLIDRGFEGPGWTQALRMCLWARLKNGTRSMDCLRTLINCNLYPNLWSYHPPFQIDGNFGLCAGMAEMLLQSSLDTIEVLPALPADWQTGEFHGFLTRCACVVSAGWSGGNVTWLQICSATDRKIKIILNKRETMVTLESGKILRIEEDN